MKTRAPKPLKPSDADHLLTLTADLVDATRIAGLGLASDLEDLLAEEAELEAARLTYKHGPSSAQAAQARKELKAGSEITRQRAEALRKDARVSQEKLNKALGIRPGSSDGGKGGDTGDANTSEGKDKYSRSEDMDLEAAFEWIRRNEAENTSDKVVIAEDLPDAEPVETEGQEPDENTSLSEQFGIETGQRHGAEEKRGAQAFRLGVQLKGFNRKKHGNLRLQLLQGKTLLAESEVRARGLADFQISPDSGMTDKSGEGITVRLTLRVLSDGDKQIAEASQEFTLTKSGEATWAVDI